MSRGASVECRFGSRRDPETIRKEGWLEMGIFAVNENDPRLTWPEVTQIRLIAERLYGKRLAAKTGEA